VNHRTGSDVLLLSVFHDPGLYDSLMRSFLFQVFLCPAECLISLNCHDLLRGVGFFAIIAARQECSVRYSSTILSRANSLRYIP